MRSIPIHISSKTVDHNQKSIRSPKHNHVRNVVSTPCIILHIRLWNTQHLPDVSRRMWFDYVRWERVWNVHRMCEGHSSLLLCKVFLQSDTNCYTVSSINLHSTYCMFSRIINTDNDMMSVLPLFFIRNQIPIVCTTVLLAQRQLVGLKNFPRMGLLGSRELWRNIATLGNKQIPENMNKIDALMSPTQLSLMTTLFLWGM